MEASIPNVMHAMVLEAPGQPLQARQVPVPEPGPQQVLIRVQACGVCRTDLHILDGELKEAKLPLIPGHQIAGTVVRVGRDVDRFDLGERVGVPWLGFTDGTCRYCRRGQENLCDHPLFTGYTIDGGFAEYAVADQRYCFPLPESYPDAEAAPLLCAGLIGYRTYRLAGENVERLGIYGFGAAAHIVAQVAVHEGKEVFAFTSPGDVAAQNFALRLGAVWAGNSSELPPVPLDAALIFAPVGPLVVAALRATAKGGVVVSGGIHMSDIPSFPYSLLWEERVVRSVANLTRRDGEEFLAIAPQVPVKTEVQTFPLEEANEALERLRRGQLQGAAVLVV
ncbi:MAG TPA: zinc-dependent alcohol dehydrogenase family protein [Anaerolineales bacterium]